MQNVPTGAAGEAVSAPTLSQRVNAIFAAYVAVEAEQYQLGDLETPEADAEADALGNKALALAQELDGIEDYSGSADLAAARALHELMLLNQWNKLGQFEWGEDSRDHLAVVAALAGITTGAVREQARRVMATKGIVIPDEATDPMLDLVRREDRYRAAYREQGKAGIDVDSDEWDDANDGAAGVLLCTDPPMPTTLAGAVAAVRHVAEDVDFLQVAHGRILGQALAYFDGYRPPLVAVRTVERDPIHAEIERHCAARAALNEAIDFNDDPENWSVENKAEKAAWERFSTTYPTTLAGAAAMAEYALHSPMGQEEDNLREVLASVAVVTATFASLEGRAAR